MLCGKLRWRGSGGREGSYRRVAWVEGPRAEGVEKVAPMVMEGNGRVVGRGGVVGGVGG